MMTAAARAAVRGGHLAGLAPLVETWSSGLHALPPTVEHALERLGELHDTVGATSPRSPEETMADWEAGVVLAALSGAPMPDFDELHAAVAQAERDARTRAALFSAIASLTLRTAVAIVEDRHAIWGEHVLPPLEELMTEVTEVGATLSEIRTAEAALRGDEDQRTAWLRLPDLNRRYARLRRAALSLNGNEGWLFDARELPETSTDVGLLDVAVPSLRELETVLEG